MQTVSRRAILSGLAGMVYAAPGQAADDVVMPEQFGAKGDGVTDDSAAMAALSAHVTARSGGTVIFRPAVYLIGAQRAAPLDDPGFAFQPAPLLEFQNCRRPLILLGNGATLRCAPGLRYGTFDRVTGAATRHQQPFYGVKEVATPYTSMIRVTDCRGAVEISDLELDGSRASHLLGGGYDATGWQIPCTGIALYNNHGAERLRRLHLHHHALDGLLIDGLDPRSNTSAAGLIEDVRCEDNGRQGCSIVGGGGYAFTRCHFARTGRGPFASAPAAGVDLEAEGGKQIRRVHFKACSFSDNVGAGLVAEVGDVSDIACSDCRFVGTTNWAAWPNKPSMRFDHCLFAGAIVNAKGGPPGLAARFTDCRFVDDLRASPTGHLYFSENPDRPIAALPYSQGALFRRCRFSLSGQAVLPWSVGVIFEDCVMRQRSAKLAFPRGRYRGKTIINGNVALLGSSLEPGASVLLNGKPWHP